MKSIAKKVILNMIAIFLVSSLMQGLSYQGDPYVLFLAALLLSFANAFIKPFLKILLLPINIITLGLTGWIVNVIILFLVTIIIPGFEVNAFELTLFGTTIVLSQFFSYIAISFALSLFTSIISWIID